MTVPNNTGTTSDEGAKPDEAAPETEGTETEGTSTEGTNGNEGEGGTGESGTVPEVPVVTTTTTTETGPVAPVQNKAGQIVFKINGVESTDATAVQTYINGLEGAARETKMSNRKEFVQGLAASNKISAAQMTAMEAYVTDPELSDRQYESWCALWDAAPPLATLGNHDAGGGSSTVETDAAKADEDKVNVARAIVKQHKLSNMPVDKIKATASYQTLIAADPEFKL